MQYNVHCGSQKNVMPGLQDYHKYFSNTLFHLIEDIVCAFFVVSQSFQVHALRFYSRFVGLLISLFNFAHKVRRFQVFILGFDTVHPFASPLYRGAEPDRSTT